MKTVTHCYLLANPAVLPQGRELRGAVYGPSITQNAWIEGNIPKLPIKMRSTEPRIEDQWLFWHGSRLA